MLIVEIEKILRQAGEIILNANYSEINANEKDGHANFVTNYDRKVQSFLKNELLKLEKDASFIGEEGEMGNINMQGLTFIVDPIDGTTNFIKNLKHSAISVGVLKDGEPYIGCVYNPYLNEMFGAQKGLGSFVSGKKIHVSNKPLNEGLVIFGTSPYYDESKDLTFKSAYEYYNKALDIRRSGSAALDLCYVAAGRYELFFEYCLSPWDYAAASIIITEAGGVIRRMDNKELRFDEPCGIISHNGLCE